MFYLFKNWIEWKKPLQNSLLRKFLFLCEIFYDLGYNKNLS